MVRVRVKRSPPVKAVGFKDRVLCLVLEFRVRLSVKGLPPVRNRDGSWNAAFLGQLLE